eukprot:Clim_evm2s183 gene=Clim_evmTU2s183
MAERVNHFKSQLGGGGSSGSSTVTITDNRTGEKREIPIEEGTIPAGEFQKLKMPLRVYDPAFGNTAVCRSKICFIDGDKGVLLYRGIPIEQLAQHSNFLEVAYLLINGSLPNAMEYSFWQQKVMRHTFVHETLKTILTSFRYDAHPMGVLMSAFSAMGTFHQEANPALQGSDLYQRSRAVRLKQIYRILGKAPTAAAIAYRVRMGRPINDPSDGLSYTSNFLYMMDRLSEENYQPNPRLARALDILFILHADHELNCSTAAVRHIASSKVDPYSAMAGGIAALYGPLHGGANEAVLRMLEEIGSKDKIAQFLDDVKARKRKLMGFGHRVYRNYDPRAKIIRQVAYDVFDIVGSEPLIEVAQELEKQALSDDYFVSRKLYPNVDFYSGIIYRAMGFPTDMFPVLFAIPRMAGWLAHWEEAQVAKDAQRIWRPRQIYVGPKNIDYVDMNHRHTSSGHSLTSYDSNFGRRTRVATWTKKGNNSAL